MQHNQLSIVVPSKARGLAALILAALAGCASTSAAASGAISAATILDACDRGISGDINKSFNIKLWESRDEPAGRAFKPILDNIKILERANIQMNCKVKDNGKSVYLYGQAIDFVMAHARREKVLQDIYDFEFHQIAMAVRLSGNQMILDGNFGNFHAEGSQVVKLMFKTIIRLRKEYYQSLDSIDSANRNLVTAMVGVASFFLIAKAIGRILPEIPYSSSIASGSDVPASAPTWAIVKERGYFEVKCSNKSYTYSLYACGNMGLFDKRGYYREGMGGCFYKSVEKAAQELCTR